jgi:hypothetical protein
VYVPEVFDDSESLDDLTYSILWESPTATPLWEAFWQAQPDGDAAEVEHILDALHREGLFTFEFRPMNSFEPGTPMSDAEVRAAIRDPRYRDPTTLTGAAVWMIPTDRYRIWQERADSPP